MKYVERNNFKISAFSLGTVQLGMNYGLGDYTKKPEKSYAFEILNASKQGGVNLLDTANNYGESEAVIGDWLQTVKPEERPLVITKIGPFDHSSPENLRNDIINQAKGCLKTLKVDCIDCLMAHDMEDYLENPTIVKQTFDELKEMGITKHIGISAYSRHDYKVIANSGFEMVQIPINVFDWTQINNGGIQALADAGMTVFARSVFLQGLVFMKPEQLDDGMDFCRAPLNRYLEICKEFDMSPAVLALSFVLSLPAISSVTLGCQRVEHVENNCKLIDEVRTLSKEQLKVLEEAFSKIDPRVINPATWSNEAWKNQNNK